ncbi:amidoligase family protein [Actinoplanes sp. L3-i22]|uniref:amidoligase family protein n=1 Tax=Actinoplanes sp. L3-i22 TaxID=2836373 RepID=UPI001C76F0F8|nr:amidoligase family protein [Actinoplanes sp. L3-i22]BCY08940.1 hypothetical protein L3i22_040280 [Actinoplanes sp. L3-i22]
MQACDHCDRPTAQTTRISSRSLICDDCRNTFFVTCEHCQDWRHHEDRCPNGCDERAESDFDDLVHDYFYQPMPIFHGNGPLYLGPEIEVEVGDGDPYRCAEIALDSLGELGYLKRDGSLNDGFEIVTHPMSYAWAIEHFPWDMFARLREHGCFAGASTGIHVHLSRAGFSSTGHSYRWMKFIYRNEPQVLQVARRRSFQWAAFRDEDRRAVKAYVKGDCYGDRYRAINTNNPMTYEIRVFAGSLDPDTVRAAFAFSVATVEYTRELTVAQIAAGGWEWRAFTGWLHDRPQYAPLVRQLQALACAC